MGTTERRERAREDLRERIVEAARDIVSEEGLDALSMRALAERIEYSPATIYLYFKDKDELLHSIMHEGHGLLMKATRENLMGLGESAAAAEKWAAVGRAYASFALDHAAYFRIMFELPTVAHVECPEPDEEDMGETWAMVEDFVKGGMAEGDLPEGDPMVMALAGWGLIHGLTSLYMGGKLAHAITSKEQFMEFLDQAMRYLGSSSEETTAGAAP